MLGDAEKGEKGKLLKSIAQAEACGYHSPPSDDSFVTYAT